MPQWTKHDRLHAGVPRQPAVVLRHRYASLSPPIPYTALMSLLSVALSSATAKSNSMILPDACRVNIQPARKACSINAESLLNLSGIHAQFRRFGCAISVVYAHVKEFLKEKFQIAHIPCYFWLLTLLKMVKPDTLNECMMKWASQFMPENDKVQ